MPTLKYFQVKNQTEDSVDLYFYGDICSSTCDEWEYEDKCPQEIKDALEAAAGRSINIYINSGGGSAFAGIAIYNMIRRYAETVQVSVTVDGIAGSIASVIALSGNSPLKIPGNAFLVIHNPYGMIEGDAGELRRSADMLDEVKTSMVGIYMEHAKEGVTEDQIRAMMDAETWLSGMEAAQYFDVETTEDVQAAAATGDYLKRAKHIPKGFKAEPAKNRYPDPDAQEAKRITNKRAQIKRTIIHALG